jgi:hypothetical protein
VLTRDYVRAGPLKALRLAHQMLKPRDRLAAARPLRLAWIFPVVGARVQSEVCPMFLRLGTEDSRRHRRPGQCWRGPASAISIWTDWLPLSTTPRPKTRSGRHSLGAGSIGLRAHDEDSRNEAHVEYLRTIQPYHCDEGYSIPGEFVVAMARKK